MTEVIVISSSLHPDSRSRLLSRMAYERLSQKVEVEFIDLRDTPLPICDGDAAYSHPNVPLLENKITNANCILLGLPVYNFAAGASAKNLIELTGRAWEQKVVGFLCAAGGQSSYMAVMGLANSLMLDFRCHIVPRFVYAQHPSFDADRIIDEQIISRVEELADTALRLTRALTAAPLSQ